jgi:penicillin-binding protein-related factor A (putative recombinase)
MPNNRGKAFEAKFKTDFQKSFPEGTIDRIYDVTSGHKTVSNICDFLGYNYPNIFYLECKSHLGNTFPLANLTQYDKLKDKVDIKGVRVGVILWMIDHDTVMYVPLSTITKMKEDGKKSVNIKMLADNTYRIIQIPSEKKRVFLDSNYSVLASLNDGE